MHRRALLASLAAGAASVAGCARSTGGDAPPATSTRTERLTETTPADAADETPPTDEPPRPDSGASVVELETGPRTYAFAPTTMRTGDEAEVALWFDRTATADHPARLRGWLRNANDFENTFQVEWIPAVGRVHGRQPDGYGHEASLHLAPTENNALAQTVPEVVRDDTGYWRVADVGPWMAETVRLAPGERVELEYVVVGEPGMTERPTGTHEFRGDGETARIAVWDPTSPGPEAESRFAGRSVPAFEGEGSVAWYHDADRTTTAFVRPSAERVELDALVEFEMVNHTSQTLRCGHWNLHKLVDGRWFHVAPWGHTSDCRGLLPGETLRWSLRAFNGEAVPCGESTIGGDGLTRGYLGGGEYAVVAGYGHPADESAALVELVGDPAEVVPTDDAESERDGSTVTVTTPRHGDGEHPPDATLALTRADMVDGEGAADAGDAGDSGDAGDGGNPAVQRVIAEQVMASSGLGAGGSGLRNLLAFAGPDVERVVLRTDEHAFGGDLREPGATQRFRFRGESYEITRVGEAATTTTGDASGE